MTITTSEKIETARRNLVTYASEYAASPCDEFWRELCRAKATLDALLRCAR